MAEVRIDPGLRESAFRSRRRQLEHMLTSHLGPIEETSTLPDLPRTEPAEPPGQLVDHHTLGTIEQPTLADQAPNGSIEQPTLADQPRHGPSVQRSTLPARPDSEPVERPSPLGDRPDIMAIRQRSAVEFPALFTARTPGWSNAGRVTALAMVAGVALVLLVLGVG